MFFSPVVYASLAWRRGTGRAAACRRLAGRPGGFALHLWHDGHAEGHDVKPPQPDHASGRDAQGARCGRAPGSRRWGRRSKLSSSKKWGGRQSVWQRPEKRGISLEAFRAIVAKALGVETERIVRDASFVGDLAADSIKLVEMMLDLEERGIEIPGELAWELETVDDA